MNEPNNFQIKEPGNIEIGKSNNIEVKEPGNIEIIDMNRVPIPEDLLNDENLVGNAISMATGISHSPLDKMDAGELEVLLNMPNVDTALKMEARARLNSMKREEGDTLGRGNAQVQAKRMSLASEPFKSKGREDDAGYINIIILMLTVWATCLCGMAYVYSQLSIMG